MTGEAEMNETTKRAWRSWVWLGEMAFLVVVAVTALAAEPSHTGNASLKDVKASLDAARADLAEGRPAKASAKLTGAIAQFEAVLAADRVPSGARQLIDQCKSLRDDLELEGVDVSAITVPSLKKAGPVAAKGKPAAPDPDEGMTKNAGQFFGRPPPRRPVGQAVSFSREIAPVLVRSCGGCHINGKRGNFQFASYADLMQTGVVQRGAGEASRLVEVIISGDMPRGGGRVAPDEIGAIMKWIDAGAVFDGPDPQQRLQTFGAAAPPAAGKPRLQAALVAKLAAGEVSFTGDVAPVLKESCYSCHGDFRTEGGFSMKTFDQLLKGGRSGEAILPKRGAESLLVKKLRGKEIEGQQMPLNRPPLSDAVIAMIERWVNEGGRLDAQSAGEELPVVAARGRARKFSHEELRDVRMKAATNLWSRALPDEPPEIERRGDVSIVGNLSASRMQGMATVVETVWKDLEAEVTEAQPLLKGGMVVFAFEDGADLSDFWLAAFGTERPKGVDGTGGISGDVAYAALVVPDDETGPDVKLLVTEQLVAAAVAGRGAPSWFAVGMGRAIAAARVPRAPQAAVWRKQLPDAVRQMGSAEALFAEEPAGSEDWRIASGGFVGSLVGKSNRGAAVLARLDEGAAFNAAFQEAFAGPPEPLFTAWAAKEMARSQRR